MLFVVTKNMKELKYGSVMEKVLEYKVENNYVLVKILYADDEGLNRIKTVIEDYFEDAVSFIAKNGEVYVVFPANVKDIIDELNNILKDAIIKIYNVGGYFEIRIDYEPIYDKLEKHLTNYISLGLIMISNWNVLTKMIILGIVPYIACWYNVKRESKGLKLTLVVKPTEKPN